MYIPQIPGPGAVGMGWAETGSSLWIDVNGAPQNLYWAGGFDIELTDTNDPGNTWDRVVFCVDLLTDVNVPGTYNTVLDNSDNPYLTPGDPQAVRDSLERVGWLLANRWPSGTQAAQAVQGAALQLAIWDIVSDRGNGFDPGVGSVVSRSTDPSNPTNPDVLSAAIADETASDGLSAPFGIVYHNNYPNHGAVVQTLMGAGPHDIPGPVPLPEPSALLLIIFQGIALIGASCLCGLRRRARTN
jgi:hypothetical protein